MILSRNSMTSCARLLLGSLFLVVAACGGSSPSPAAPSGSGSGAGSTTPPATSGGSAAAAFAISVDGVPFNAVSVTAICSAPGPEIVQVVGVSGSGTSTTSLGFAALAQVGVQTIAASQFTQSVMTAITGSSSAAHMAFQTIGRGSITITAISATSVSGTVDLVLVPTSGSTTNRIVTGNFTATIASNATCTSPAGTLPGGSSGGSTPVPTTGVFTASIDGSNFNGAFALTATLINGQLSVSGADNTNTLQIILGGVTGPGTFPISSQRANAAGLVQNGTALSWGAGPTTGSGTVTISSLTSTSVAGTFTLTLTALNGGASRTITNGVFNVPLSTSSAVPPSVPSGPTTGTPAGLVLNVDGTEWRPTGAVQATRTAQGFVTIGAADVPARGFSVAILASAVGTYSLNNPASHNALYSLGTQTWFTSRPGGGGSITISSISTTRVTGSFDMTLAATATNSDQHTVRATGTFDLPF